MYDDYDPTKETLKEYIDRRLTEQMKEEANVWVRSVLHGENSGGPLRGLLSKNEEIKKSY